MSAWAGRRAKQRIQTGGYSKWQQGKYFVLVTVLVSACLGFWIGAYGFYRDAFAKACIAVERYPLLLRLHMHANFPGERFDLWDVARMRSAFRRERLPQWRLSSMLLASWMTATPALDVSFRVHLGSWLETRGRLTFVLEDNGAGGRRYCGCRG